MVIHSHSSIAKRLSPHPFSFTCYILKPLRGPLSTFLYSTVYELCCLRQSTPFSLLLSLLHSLSVNLSLLIVETDIHIASGQTEPIHGLPPSRSSASLASKLSSLLRISGVLESRTIYPSNQKRI